MYVASDLPSDDHVVTPIFAHRLVPCPSLLLASPAAVQARLAPGAGQQWLLHVALLTLAERTLAATATDELHFMVHAQGGSSVDGPHGAQVQTVGPTRLLVGPAVGPTRCTGAAEAGPCLPPSHPDLTPVHA